MTDKRTALHTRGIASAGAEEITNADTCSIPPTRCDTTQPESNATLDSLSYAEPYIGDESDLISAAKSGMPNALEHLFSRHRPKVYGAVRCFSSWLIAIAINTALSNIRRDRRVRWTDLDACDGDSQSREWGLSNGWRNPEQDRRRYFWHPFHQPHCTPGSRGGAQV